MKSVKIHSTLQSLASIVMVLKYIRSSHLPPNVAVLATPLVWIQLFSEKRTSSSSANVIQGGSVTVLGEKWPFANIYYVFGL